jgi:hypothetical protein
LGKRRQLLFCLPPLHTPVLTLSQQETNSYWQGHFWALVQSLRLATKGNSFPYRISKQFQAVVSFFSPHENRGKSRAVTLLERDGRIRYIYC